MKKCVLICTFILIVAMFIIYSLYGNKELVHGDVSGNIYTLANPNVICSEFSKDDKFRVGIYNRYTYDETIIPSLGSCSGTSYYNQYLSTVKKGDDYTSWTRVGRLSSDTAVYIDDVVVKESGKNSGYYSYFYINNALQEYDSNDILKQYNTLKAGEKIFFDINLSDKDIQYNSSSDLRLSINYGHGGSDIVVHAYKALTYYVYTDEITDGSEVRYGPYEIEYFDDVGVYTASNILRETNIVSENLLGKLPPNVNISKIRVVPYELSSDYKGNFKIFSLSVDLYDSKYNDSKKYVTVSDAANLTRHNIVNNLIAAATVKWSLADDSREMMVYYSDGRGPIVMNHENVFYGMPYVTAKVLKGTLKSFLGRTTKIEENNKLATNAYKVTDKYLSSTKSSDGNSYTKGNLIDESSTSKKTINVINSANSLYSSGPTATVTSTLTNHKISSENAPEFINNVGGYLVGTSCSTSAGAAYGPEVPYNGYISSYDFFTTNQMEIVGGLELSKNEVYDAMRIKEVTGSKATFDYYYSSVFHNKYGIERLYDAYGQTLPGDFLAHPGHVEKITGRTYVECDDGTHTQYYTTGFCNNHGGINPTKSYFLVSGSSGSTYVFRGDDSTIGFAEEGDVEESNDDEIINNNGIIIDDEEEEENVINNSSNSERNFALSSETGWEYTLNPRYTDLTSIDEVYTNSNVHIGGIVNKKVYFSYYHYKDSDSVKKDIMNADSQMQRNNDDVNYDMTSYVLYKQSKSTFLPFRLTIMDELSTNKVEKPTVKYQLDKEYTDEEKNTLLYNYMKENKKLKGTLIANYMINGIRIEINKQKYYIYPNQTNYYSLYSNLTDEEILNALSNLNYDKYNEIIISMDMGPNIDVVRNTMKADSEGYYEVLKIKTPGMEPEEKVTSKDSNTTINGNEIDIKIPYNYILTYGEINNKLEIVGDVTIKNAKGETVTSNDEALGTGSKIILSNSEYVIVISGDINKDGKITALDYIAVRNYMMNTKEIDSNQVEFKAADMNSDGKISALDYIAIRKIMMNES